MNDARKYWIMAAAMAVVAGGLFATAIFGRFAFGQDQARDQSKDQNADYHAAQVQTTDQATDYQTAKDKSDQDRKQYADKVRESYNFRFGKDNLFIPGT